jgi:hypothetical protein
MSDREEARRALRGALAPQLARAGTPLSVIAEDVLGEEDGEIDWVAASPDGIAWVVLVEAGPGGAALLERGLVQRAWVGRRLRDWCKLAPGLPLRPDLPTRALLIARDFPRSTQLAAREAAGEEIALARWNGEPERPGLEPLPALPRPRREAEPSPTRLVSVFRSGLTDADLTH